MNIKTEFNKEIKKITGKIDEIKLFIELIKVLNSTHPSTLLLKKTHQNKIFFKSKVCSSYKGKEISDILFIVYSDTPQKLFISFMQCKDNKKRDPLVKFSADYFQYELLSTRPKIVSNKKFPENILSFTKHSSIGNYGIFFEKGGDYDLAYSIAQKLNIKSSIPLAINCCLSSQIKNYNIQIPTKNITAKGELIAAANLCDFLTSLVKFKIGAPVVPRNKEILNFLKSLIEELMKSHATDTTLISFKDFFELHYKDAKAGDDMNASSFIPKVVIVKSMEENRLIETNI